jgi:hypothetical protein
MGQGVQGKKRKYRRRKEEVNFPSVAHMNSLLTPFRLRRDAELFLTKLSRLDGAERVGRLMETIANSKRIVVVPKPVEKPATKPVEKVAEKPAEESVENVAKKSAEKPVEEVVEKPAEEVTETALETPAEKSDEAVGGEETT